jgi:4-amino-4-deoxy-L-arabinose transferase-like glycosyltransferase
MALIRRFGAADFVLLRSILAVAVGARAAYLGACADSGRAAGPLRVQDAQEPLPDDAVPEDLAGQHPTELQVLIHSVRNGGDFRAKAPFAPGEERTAHASPGYPWLLGQLARAVGDDRLDSTVRWLQCALGGLTAGLYFLFARRAFRSLFVGGFVGFLAALYPFWVINTAEVADGVVATFLLALVLFLGARASQTGAPLASLLFGLALAGTALVRAALLPFAFVTLAWFLLRTRGLRRGWLPAVLAFLGFAGGLAPWTVRNFQVFGEPIPIVDSLYYHLWMGNNPHADGGPLTKDMLASAPAEELRKIDKQPARYARLGKDVIGEIRTQPIQTVHRRVLAALKFYLGDRWFKGGEVAEKTKPDEEVPAWLRDSSPMLLSLTLVLMLALALFGWRLTYGWRWESMPAVLAAVFVPLPYVLGHAESLSGPRLPLDGVLLCYAAFAVACCLPTVGGYLREAEGAGAPTQEAP